MSRAFGIEIEAYGIAQETLAEAIRAVGIPCEVQAYNHVDSATTWKITRDGSIQGPDSFELVSPILEGDDGLAQVQAVCQVLGRLGAHVNRSCGLHVHHDARDLDLGDWKNLLALYVNYESALDALMPPSRRGNTNTYCQSVRQFGDIGETADRIMACETLAQLSALFASRQIKINFHAFWRHGSIEFRHHSGTVQAEKIIHWVRLTGLMMDKARAAHGIVLSPDDDIDRKLTSLLRLVKAPAALKRFYQERQRRFWNDNEEGSE